MSKDEIFDSLKSTLNEWEREDIIECLSTICTELIDNRVSFGSGRVYLEDGFLKWEDTRNGISSIRDTFTLNFERHDEEVKEQFMKELVKNIPSPKECNS